MGSHRYVFAILPRHSSVPTGVAGLGDTPLSLVAIRDLAVLVCALDGESLTGSSENLLRHESVVEAARRHGPALPVRFGTILPDEAAVRSAVDERYDVLCSDLRRLGDKLEFGLSVLWVDPQAVSQGERTTSQSADALAGTGEGSGTAYLRARFRAYQREGSLKKRATEIAARIEQHLAPAALDYRLTEMPSETLPLRGTFLLDPSGVETFRDRFDRYRVELSDVRCVLSGPWPPYSFVTPPDQGIRAAGHNRASAARSDETSASSM